MVIRGEYITLGQLLKAQDFVGSGAEVKQFLAETEITVNGEPDNRRGRKLRPGDTVRIANAKVITIRAEPST